MIPITKASTDQSLVVRVNNEADGLPTMSAVWNTAGANWWYWRMGATNDVTSLSLANLASPSVSHADGGFVHLADGDYRLDLPDAVVATGVNRVRVGGSFTNMKAASVDIVLTDADLYDAASLGLSILDNISSGIATVDGIVDNLSTNLDALDTKVDNVSSSLAVVDGIVDNLSTNLDALDTKVDNLSTNLDGLTTNMFGFEVDNDGTAISMEGAFKLILSVLTGKSTGGGTLTLNFRDIADTKNRLTVTVDPTGNRTALVARDAT